MLGCGGSVRCGNADGIMCGWWTATMSRTTGCPRGDDEAGNDDTDGNVEGGGGDRRMDGGSDEGNAATAEDDTVGRGDTTENGYTDRSMRRVVRVQYVSKLRAVERLMRAERRESDLARRSLTSTKADVSYGAVL